CIVHCLITCLPSVTRHPTSNHSFPTRRSSDLTGGRHFHCLKFRTMVTDSEQVLQDALATDPELLAEWNATRKLRNDPRITRLGRSEEHTSELQSQSNLVCRLLLEKKNIK